MNWLSYATVLGLALNLIGAIVIAVAQSRLFVVINGWLLALDFYVETTLERRSPIVRFEGWDRQMEAALPRTRRVSAFGWALIVLGAALQIPGALPK